MNITGTAAGIRPNAFSQSSNGVSGAFNYTNVIGDNATVAASSALDTRKYGWVFNGTDGWSGNTSENGGDTSKPATVAFMWILRFI